MKSMMKRTTMREIKNSFGRYFAILAIVALGVGFFSGLKITKPAMIKTINDFLRDKNFFDLHLMSTLGFDDEDVDDFSKEADVRLVEGAYMLDAIYTGISDSENVLKTISLPDAINNVRLINGRMPVDSSECIIDSRINDISIGDKIYLSEENDENTYNLIDVKEFTVVGTAESSYYINFERGTTSIGNGKVLGFMYAMPEAFDCDYYTDVFVCFNHDYEIFSDEYEDYIDEKKAVFEDVCETVIEADYQDMINDVKAELEDQLSEQMGGNVDFTIPQLAELLQQTIDENIPEPDSYVLDRNTNIGYVCFESDSNIVNSISKVFPVFFILVAALVCMTTMNRMVEEQRTQIGVLKALGFSEVSIMGKFLFYSGSAAIIGCIIGYFVGTYVFPAVIWTAYHIMYLSFGICYIFDYKLALISLAVSVICSLGITWLSCRYELTETAACLMRPKAPKAGKRVLLEKIPFIWKRLKFLHKVSVRNIFRYKKRFFMMILGISGCTALLLTGFGINDSIAGFAKKQYEEILISDGSIVLKREMDASAENELTELLDDISEKYSFVSETTWDLVSDKKVKPINLAIMEEPDDIGAYLDLHTERDEAIAYPQNGEAVISNAIANIYGITVGDDILIRDSSMNEINVKVSGIFINHVYNYVYISPETYTSQLGKEPSYKTIYINFKENDDVHVVSSEIMKNSDVVSVTLNSDTKERLTKMLSSLDYIVLLIIICAAALAFIVLYNLTNINITERIREIATIKVLGFFKKETSSYVFRENFVLTSLGIVVGLVLGVFLHAFVMNQIHVDMVSFDTYIAPLSYLYSIAFTFIFNFGVNRVMSVKLDKINMAESLKSVD